MTVSQRKTLEKRADEGKYVSFIHDYPDIPDDVNHIHEAFMTLRNSTSADKPVSFHDKVSAWEMFGMEDFETFAGFIARMDGAYLEEQSERMKRERERQQKKAAANQKPQRRPASRQPLGRSSTKRPAGRKR